MSAPLMKNKHAQAAYRFSQPRRRHDVNCFCGQSGTALLFGMVAGYTTLLCTGLHFVTTSMGEGEDGGGDDEGKFGVGGQQDSSIHSSQHHHQNHTHEVCVQPVYL
jgi:hypothetical protein